MLFVSLRFLLELFNFLGHSLILGSLPGQKTSNCFAVGSYPGRGVPVQVGAFALAVLGPDVMRIIQLIRRVLALFLQTLRA